MGIDEKSKLLMRQNSTLKEVVELYSIEAASHRRHGKIGR